MGGTGGAGELLGEEFGLCQKGEDDGIFTSCEDLAGLLFGQGRSQRDIQRLHQTTIAERTSFPSEVHITGELATYRFTPLKCYENGRVSESSC